MVATEYKIAYGEVLEILKHISKEEFNKIPPNMVEMFRENASNENEFVYNPNKTLQEQNVSEIARAIIAILFRDYWATETQREKILAKQNYDREKLKGEMYSYDNMSKNARKENEDTTENLSIIEYKESFFTKFINKIKSFFKFKRK